MKKNKKISLREAFHTLGNRHYLTILIPGLIRKTLEKALAEKALSEEIKKVIEKIIIDLTNLETAGKDADTVLKKIKSKVYENLNPDEIYIETEGLGKELYNER